MNDEEDGSKNVKIDIIVVNNDISRCNNDVWDREKERDGDTKGCTKIYHLQIVDDICMKKKKYGSFIETMISNVLARLPRCKN